MQLSPPAESIYIDLSDRTKLRLCGSDRVRFLNGQVSNDVRLATAETSVYTGVMTIKGKLCADAFVHAGVDDLLIDADGDLRESLVARLERYMIADDVQLTDVTDDLGLLHLIDFAVDHGPARYPDIRPALTALGASLHFVTSRRYGREGVDVFFPTALDAQVRHTLHAAFTELNGDAVEAWRIIAGVPRWGAELDADTMPAEAGIEERAVSFTKGCYIGQEIVSRVKSVGHVNRQLRGLRALDASPLFAGMNLRVVSTDPAVGEPNRAIGRITSAAPAAGHGGAGFVGLGYIRRGFDAPGTVLEACLEGSADGADEDSGVTTPPCRVEVCKLPFV